MFFVIMVEGKKEQICQKTPEEINFHKKSLKKFNNIFLPMQHALGAKAMIKREKKGK